MARSSLTHIPSDIILKGIHPGTITPRLGLIWFSGFKGEDLNVIFYHNMANDSPALYSRWLLLLKI
jgi:hypothetical protein